MNKNMCVESELNKEEEEGKSYLLAWVDDDVNEFAYFVVVVI